MSHRVVEKTSNGYKYSYCPQADHCPSDYLAGCGSRLTFRQHRVNQYHNELQALIALQDTQITPRLLDYSQEDLSMTVEDVGESQWPVQASDIRSCIDVIAKMHHHFNSRPIDLRDVWHSSISEDYYFSFVEHAVAASGGCLADIAEDLPTIVVACRGFRRRPTKADSGITNLVLAKRGPVLLDFETTHMGYQTVDLVELIWSFDPNGSLLSPEDWGRLWEQYCEALRDVENPDWREFLFVIIRKTFWTLRHHDAQGQATRAFCQRAIWAYNKLMSQQQNCVAGRDYCLNS